MTTGTLYIVGTPIGNLEDISFRALRTLKDVDLIAAEDTRRTKILTSRYDIRTPLSSYHQHNEKKKCGSLLTMLRRGSSIALVSDAGMPSLSDPGNALISEAIRHGIPVVPVPGPTAVTSALAVSGFDTRCFSFFGFLPLKGASRKKFLNQLCVESRTSIVFLSPHRITRELEAIIEVCGNRQVVVARELTKKFEEMIRGSLKEVINNFKSRKAIKGEFVLVMEGRSQPAASRDIDRDAIRTQIMELQEKFDLTQSEAIKITAYLMRLDKKMVYKLVCSQE